MSFLINPYAFLAAGGDFESIATVTVGSGGASTIEFTSIPGTFQHLQIRGIARSTRAGFSTDFTKVQLNGDTGSNYCQHALIGSGTAATASGNASIAYFSTGTYSAATATADVFGACVVDILDYADSSKNATARALTGVDINGSGFVIVNSGAWLDTSAVSSVKVTLNGGNFAQHSTLALYGLRAP